jgi:hypothetical protein
LRQKLEVAGKCALVRLLLRRAACRRPFCVSDGSTRLGSEWPPLPSSLSSPLTTVMLQQVALVALWLYALYPIVRSTYTGVRDADPAAVAAAIQTSGKATLTIDGEEVALGPAEIEVIRSPRSGWFVATEDNLTVALDLEITPELRRAGIARDVVRLVQQARKDIGLQIPDRIDLIWAATGETAESINEHRGHIQAEVLALTCTETSDPPAAPATVEDLHLGVKVWIEPADDR